MAARKFLGGPIWLQNFFGREVPLGNFFLRALVFLGHGRDCPWTVAAVVWPAPREVLLLCELVVHVVESARSGSSRL